MREFSFKADGKNIYYSGDVGSVDDLLLFKDSKIHLLITEAAHISFDDIINVSETFKPGKIILTHLNEKDIPGLKNKMESTKDDFLIIAEDGLLLGV